jgi:hypothetical protein
MLEQCEIFSPLRLPVHVANALGHVAPPVMEAIRSSARRLQSEKDALRQLLECATEVRRVLPGRCEVPPR